MFQEGGWGWGGLQRVNVDSLTKAAAAAEAQGSTGKESGSSGPQGVQVQGDCQCLPFNELAPPPHGPASLSHIPIAPRPRPHSL